MANNREHDGFLKPRRSLNLRQRRKMAALLKSMVQRQSEEVHLAI